MDVCEHPHLSLPLALTIDLLVAPLNPVTSEVQPRGQQYRLAHGELGGGGKGDVGGDGENRLVRSSSSSIKSVSRESAESTTFSSVCVATFRVV